MERDKALEVALGQIEKQFGKGSIMRMGETAHMAVESLSTGAMALDIALGVGGLPRGRIVEIYGPESSGKSTLAMHVVAEAQRNGGICAYVDAEHAMDPVYAKAIGVNVDDLLISQPDTGEQALEISDMLIRSGALDVLVIDSVAALTPRAEIEGEMGDTHVGLQARLMSQALRKLTSSISKSRTIAVFINQLREKIGVVYGSPEVTPGGRALKFYASVRIDIRRVESIKDGAEIVGSRTRAKVVKNKCVAEGSRVFDPITGETHAIEDVVMGGAATSVVAADKLGKLHARPIIQRMDQGEHEVIGLRLRDGTELWVTADHKVMTDSGWRCAGDLMTGDRLARPRCAFGFGDAAPVTPDQARMLGYLVGDGCMTGKTPVLLTNVEPELHEDARRIAGSLGCDARVRGIQVLFPHRKGEKNGLLELARWAGIWGDAAPEQRVPAAFFDPSTSREVVGNLVFGIWESEGWMSYEQTGAIRCGIVITSEQLAHQLHWLLLRFGIGSSLRRHVPSHRRPGCTGGRRIQSCRPVYQVHIGGMDNVTRFASALPMWGPKGQKLRAALEDLSLRRHRGSQRGYLAVAQTEPVLSYLRHRGIAPSLAARLVGRADEPWGDSLRTVLGVRRLRRDRVEALAEALDSAFLREILEEEVWYDRLVEVLPAEWRRVYDIEVAEDHTFVVNDVVVSNCGAPFRTAEFDIEYGKGISREGSLLDVAVNLGFVKKAGAWFTYEGEQLGQGRENAKQFLSESPQLMAEIDQRVREQLRPEGAAEQGEGDGAVDPDDLPISLEDAPASGRGQR